MKTHIDFDKSFKVIGIDPGLKGGIAFLEDNHLIQAVKMPTTQLETKTKKKVKQMTAKEKKLHKSKHAVYKTKTKVDSKAIYDLITDFEPDLVVIEKPFYLAIESRQSTATIAENIGRIYGIVESQKYKLEIVSSQTWKKYFDIGADKEEAINKAQELYPEVNLISPRGRVKSDGMAEAILLAVYGNRSN